MYKLGKKSLDRLNTCDDKLKILVTSAIVTSPIDFSVICGYRAKEEQNKAFYEGKSKLRYPQSKHNYFLSDAVDIMPYPQQFKATEKEWQTLLNHIKAVAKKLNIEIRCGIDWENFPDYPHIELKN